MKDLKELLTRLRRVSTIHQQTYQLNHGGEVWPVVEQIMHTSSEVSEVYDVFRRPNKYVNPRIDMLNEIIDVVYSALTITHIPTSYEDEEILEAFETVMRKIEKRVGIET